MDPWIAVVIGLWGLVGWLSWYFEFFSIAQCDAEMWKRKAIHWEGVKEKMFADLISTQKKVERLSALLNEDAAVFESLAAVGVRAGEVLEARAKS